jgi:hypothetical protein
MALDYEKWKEQQYQAANVTPKSDQCPTVIFTIGIVWAGIGLLLWLGGFLYFSNTRKFEGIIGLLALGWAHLYCGVTTLMGTASRPVINGLIAINFGLIYTTVAMIGAKTMTNPTAHKHAPLIVLCVGAAGVSLLVTGVLAIVYSRTYERWRGRRA